MQNIETAIRKCIAARSRRVGKVEFEQTGILYQQLQMLLDRSGEGIFNGKLEGQLEAVLDAGRC